MQNYYSGHVPQRNVNNSATRPNHSNQFSFNSPEVPQIQYDHQENQYHRKTTSPLRNRAQGNSNFNATQQYFTQQNQPRPFLDKQQEPEETIDAHINQTRDKLQGKIEAQTERLKYLDNYRVICEKRIRDLAPSHPLPVLPSHCGQPNPDIAEMKSRLNMLISSPDKNQSVEVIRLRQQVDQLMEEKQQLEIGLRDETLANEEQRNYIEILRNTIDQKMEMVGLGDLLNHKNLPQGQDPVAIYTIISDLKRELDGYKRECKNMSEQMQTNNEEITEKTQIQQQQQESIQQKDCELSQLRSEVEDLRSANFELQNCITQNSKEKNDLLEYIEENVKQIESLGRDLESERVRINEINNEKTHLNNVKVDLESSNRKLKEQVTELDQNNKSLETELEQLKGIIRQLKKDNEQRQQTMEDLSNEAAILKSQVEHLKEQQVQKDSDIDIQKQRLRSLEEQLLKLRQQYDTLSEEKLLQEKKYKIEEESLKKKIQMLDDFLHEQEERAKKLEEKHTLELEIQKRTLEGQIEGIEFNLSQTKKSLSQVEQELSDMKRLKSQLLEDNTKLDTTLQQLQESYDHKKSQYDSLKENLLYCQRELENLKHDHLQMQEELQVEVQRREWLSNEREKLNQLLEDTTARLEDMTRQKDQEQRKVYQLERELAEQKNYLGKELSSKTDNMNYLQRQQDQVSNELKKVLSQLEYTRQVKTDLESRVANLQRDYDNNVREKKIQEKVVADLKEENQHLYKNEERVKRLIEENEQLKSQIRQKERDITVLSERFKTTTGEVDTVEREFKRTQSTLQEKEFQVEALNLQKTEALSKLKETETRLFEVHREKQELESKLKATVRQLEDVKNENDTLRKMKGATEDEKLELTQHMQKLRSKMTEQSIYTELYSKQQEDLEMVVKQIADKIKYFLDDLLQKLNASDILSTLVTRHVKEQMYLLIQNIDNSLILGNADDRFTSTSSLIYEFKNFSNLIEDQYTLLLSEYLSSQTDARLLTKKVEQLETRIANINHTDVVNLEKTKFLSNEIDTIRHQRLQTVQELNQARDQEMQKVQTIKELESQIQTLQRENKFLVEKNIQNDEELRALKEEWENNKESFESNVLGIKQKEQKMSQLSKEKRELEELISKMHAAVKDYNTQRVFGEWSRSLGDKFKAQNERLKQEATLDNLERELNQLIKAPTQEEVTILRAQYLRREINDIEQRVKDCDARIETMVRKIRNLEAELRNIEETEKIEQFANNGNTQTINYLMKESQQLRNEIFDKTNKINSLEQELEGYKQNQQDLHPKQINYQSTTLLPPRTRTTTAMDTVNNSMMNTFENKLLEQKLGDRQFSTMDLNSHRALNLQPIKIEDYDYKPERHDSLNRPKTGNQTLYSLKPSTKPSLQNQRQSSARTLFDQDLVSPIQHVHSPPQLEQQYRQYLNDTQATKENFNPSGYNTNQFGHTQTKFKLGSTLVSPSVTTPLQNRLSGVRL